ncbi:UNVERIFIED_CONTAM: hypothetical protein Sindi_1967800 [Sesamum indicum]
MWDKGIAQVQFLNDFKENFNVGFLDPMKDEKYNFYHQDLGNVEVPLDDELYALLPGSQLELIDEDIKAAA